MISLDKYSKYIRDLYTNDGKVGIGAMIIDDIFRHLNRLGIDEVIVNKDQMFLIATFMSANFDDRKKRNDKGLLKALNAFKQGKVDKFMGVKLILE